MKTDGKTGTLKIRKIHGNQSGSAKGNTFSHAQRIESETAKQNTTTPRAIGISIEMKRYAELAGNRKRLGIKSPNGNNLFTSRDFIPAGSPVTSGAFNTPFLGFDIDWTSEASANVATFFHPSFLTMAVQQDMDTRVYDLGLDGKRAARINCDLLFGLKQLDDTRVVTIS